MTTSEPSNEPTQSSTAPASASSSARAGDAGAALGNASVLATQHLEAAEIVLWRADLSLATALPSFRAALDAMQPFAPALSPSLAAKLETLRARVDQAAEARGPSADDMRASLLVAGADLRRELLAPSAARRRIDAILRLALVVGVLLCIAGYLWIRGIPGAGPWRGEYFAREDLSGKPSLRYDDTIDFTWDKEPPHPELPPEKFSVRWEACLVVPRDIPDAAMQLSSDDGSRLYLDGELVIDGWVDHKGIRTRGAETPLKAGTHSLRVEYFHKSGTPRVALVASLDGGPPSVIPAGMLRRPRSAPGDAQGPKCAD